MNKSLVEDFSDIAARLSELETEKKPKPEPVVQDVETVYGIYVGETAPSEYCG